MTTDGIFLRPNAPSRQGGRVRLGSQGVPPWSNRGLTRDVAEASLFADWLGGEAWRRGFIDFLDAGIKSSLGVIAAPAVRDVRRPYETF